jgi:hypothetical protein
MTSSAALAAGPRRSACQPPPRAQKDQTAVAEDVQAG